MNRLGYVGHLWVIVCMEAIRLTDEYRSAAKAHFILCGWLLFCKYLFCGWGLVRSSLVFGLLARRTWPLALMVSTNQVPFRTSNSKRSGQSPGRLGFRADKTPSLHWSCKLWFLGWCVYLRFQRHEYGGRNPVGREIRSGHRQLAPPCPTFPASA